MMPLIKCLCCSFLGIALVCWGCADRPRAAPGGPPMLVLRYNQVTDAFTSLRRKAKAERPHFGAWESWHRPLAKHIPAWLKGIVLVRARVARIHTPLFYSPSLQQERFYVTFSVAKGQHIPGHPGLVRIKLYHGCSGMVSPRFIACRKAGKVWQFAFTSGGRVVGIVPGGVRRGAPVKALKVYRVAGPPSAGW